jgi:hypothetical protein
MRVKKYKTSRKEFVDVEEKFMVPDDFADHLLGVKVQKDKKVVKSHLGLKREQSRLLTKTSIHASVDTDLITNDTKLVSRAQSAFVIRSVLGC